ncbi:MAG: hypothetical protein HYZ23_07105 [Chloroflexi bacterium]|nr:hypothetical protein [Chloroflexota bacterium]
MALIALASSVIISVGSIAWGYSEAGFIIFSRWVILFGIVWLVTAWRGWGWLASPALAFAVMLAGAGLWFGLTPGWMFAGGIFSLFAWDMTDFRRRMIGVASDEHTRAVERRHIARISLLSLAGLFVASLAMIVRLKFTFEWGVFLVVVILLGLSQLAGWLKK